jgi:predicted nucleic acid-binding protein
VKVIIDASTLLNLTNGDVLELALALPQDDFFVSAEVRKESKTIAALIDELNIVGLLHFVDDDAISVDELGSSMAAWELGAGECECILAAKLDGSTVACDDYKARIRIQTELGRDRLSGSIGILASLVVAGLLSSGNAFQSYLRMRDAGGFLPALAAEYFRSPA